MTKRNHIEVGQRFGTLVVASEVRVSGKRVANCVCDCGATRTLRVDHLLRGTTPKTCRQRAPWRHTRSPKRRTRSPEYNAWSLMRGRCSNKKNPSYQWYGARGIKVCGRWQTSFANFLADMGPKPSPQHSLDRKDNDGNYEPGNCRWATAKEQAANRRLSRSITGKFQSINREAAQ